MMDDLTLRALVADNSWLDGTPAASWFRRALPEPFWPRALTLDDDPRQVQLIVGPRQAGKSTLIWKTLEERGRADERPGLYLNCEDPSIQRWLHSPALFLSDLDALGVGDLPLFFEEIQALDEAGRFLKGLVDRRTGRALYATGSSAFDLDARTRETLAGRAHRHLLLPFSIAELPLDRGSPSTGPVADLRRREAARRAAVFGGYPGALAAERPDAVLADLAEAFVLRDVSDRFAIRHVDAFRTLVQLAASQIGNLVNVSEWASIAGLSSDTVSAYSRLLEETHIVRLVRPFVGGKRAEITSARKVFFLDNGLRNQIFGGFQPLHGRADAGALIENLAFSELSKVLNPLLDTVRYWRSKSGAEVDFVVEHQGRRLAVEVKAGPTRGKITRAQRSFIEAYEPEALLIVGSDKHEPRRLGATDVAFLPIERLGPTVARWRLGDVSSFGEEAP